MVARGVPPATAAASVIAAARRGLGDADIDRLREHVARDIGAGVGPAEAARVRTQALIVNRSARASPSPAPGSIVPGRAP
jgi:hypothetical protein